MPRGMVFWAMVPDLQAGQRVDGRDDLVLAEQVHGPQQLAELPQLELHRAAGDDAVFQVDPVCAHPTHERQHVRSVSGVIVYRRFASSTRLRFTPCPSTLLLTALLEEEQPPRRARVHRQCLEGHLGLVVVLASLLFDPTAPHRGTRMQTTS